MNHISSSPLGLTPELLTSALAGCGLLTRARVVDVSCEHISGNLGYVGEVFRCFLTYDIDESTAPATVIAKCPCSDLAKRRLFATYGTYRRELSFYTEIHAQSLLPVPRCYWCEGDSEYFLLVLEDLLPAAPGSISRGATLTQARNSIDAMTRMHSAWWDDPRLLEYHWLPLRGGEPTTSLVSARYKEVWNELERQHNGDLPEAIRAIGTYLITELPKVVNRLSEPPLTLVHGDFQLNNILFSGDELEGVVDWQAAHKARGPMDLAHFLARSLQQEDRRSWQAGLLRRYHRGLIRGGVRNYSFKECLADYECALISEFGLGIILSSAIAETGDPEDQPADEPGNSDPGAARLVAALADLNIEGAVGGKFQRFTSFLHRHLLKV